MIDLTNWAGNLRYRAIAVHRPRTLDEACDVVRQATHLRVIGTRHCFNDIADTPHDLLSLEHLNRIDEPDRDRMTVTLEAGVTCGQLCTFLHAHGFAIHNTASLLQVSVAGAVATATHGSGNTNGNLATAVCGLEIVTADGTVKQFSRDTDGERFAGMVVSLGALGVVTKLTLEIRPTFQVTQTVYENLPHDLLKDNFDTITAAGYSVSLFTDWQRGAINQVWIKRLAPNNISPPDPTFFGATLAKKNLHPIGEISTENCTQQMTVPGPWHERLPHFRLDGTPSAGQELQSEYFIPRQHAPAAIEAIHALRDQIAPVILISEIRTIAADDLWLSPAYGQNCVGLHTTWKRDLPGVERLLTKIENTLAPFAPRPHWGKRFVMSPTVVASRYERLADFRDLAMEFDPAGKFSNDYIKRYIAN